MGGQSSYYPQLFFTLLSFVLLSFVSPQEISSIERPSDEVRFGVCYVVAWRQYSKWYVPWWKSYSPFGRNWLHFDEGTPVYIQQAVVMISPEHGGRTNQIVTNNDRVKIQQWHAETHLSLGTRICTITPYQYDYWGEDDSVHRGGSDSDIHMLHRLCEGDKCQYGIKFRNKYVDRRSNGKSIYSTTVNQRFRFFKAPGPACVSGIYDCIGSSIPELSSINEVNGNDNTTTTQMNPDIFFAEDAKQQAERKAREEYPDINFEEQYDHPEQTAKESFQGGDEEDQQEDDIDNEEKQEEGQENNIANNSTGEEQQGQEKNVQKHAADEHTEL